MISHNNKDKLRVKIAEAEARKNALLVEISRANKHKDVLETELIGEKEIIKKLQEELAWIDYQTQFS